MELRNMTIYSIFVRNHGGTFAAVEKDIPVSYTHLDVYKRQA